MNQRKEKMKHLPINFKKGFTIIEVVLVIAIAGGIILMVLIAFPALQRNANDNKRANDLARLQNAIKYYQDNNRGANPVIGSSGSTDIVVGSADPNSFNTTGSKRQSWEAFYKNYLLVDSSGNIDKFEDPDGNPYSLYITDCSKNKDAENLCGGSDPTVQRRGAKFDDQAQNTNDFAKIGNQAHHSIAIVLSATCQGEDVVYATGARKFAVAYKLEGGGSKCMNY